MVSTRHSLRRKRGSYPSLQSYKAVKNGKLRRYIISSKRGDSVGRSMLATVIRFCMAPQVKHAARVKQLQH